MNSTFMEDTGILSMVQNVNVVEVAQSEKAQAHDEEVRHRVVARDLNLDVALVENRTKVFRGSFEEQPANAASDSRRMCPREILA